MIGALIVTTFVNLTAYLLLLLILQYLCLAHLELTHKNLAVCILGSGFFLFISQLFLSETFSGFWLVFLLCFASIFIFSKKRIIDSLLFFIAFLLYTTFRVMPTMLIQMLFPALNGFFTLFGLNISIISTTIDCIGLIALFILRHKTYQSTYSSHLRTKEIIFSILLPFFCFIILALMSKAQNTVFPYNLMWNIITTATFITGFLYYFYILREAYLRPYRETVARTQTAYLRTQLDAMQDLKNREEDVHKLRHDLRNHLSVIEGLCAQGQYNKVLSYTCKLNNSYIGNSPALTGNEIADTIFHAKKKLAQEAGIDFTFEGTLSGLHSLSEPDICGLLANAYDNALEACHGQEHAYIHTKANTTKNHTYIEIRNSIPRKIQIRNQKLKTTKADKPNHGYGIEIMKQLTYKYHGSLHISSSDTEFVLELILLTPTSIKYPYE